MVYSNTCKAKQGGGCMTIAPQTVPENLKHTLADLRVRKGWKQVDAAKEIGVTTRTLQSWEKNPDKIAAKYLTKISKVYNIPLEYISFAKTI
nr:helix-turn-helix transcriptional regulator [Lactobacillus jensenii]